MDIATILGFGLGAFFVITGMLLGSSVGQVINAFWDFPSVMIVGGGTVATVFMNFTMTEIKNLPKIINKLMYIEKQEIDEIISALVSFAEKARREGLLALEDDVEKLDDEFLKKGVQLVVDGTDPELVRRILETEMFSLEERHSNGKKMFDCMGAYAPAFGMIGTLIGLIKMLGDMDDPAAIGPGMSVALLTTMYGAMAANWVFLPLSGKLGMRHSEESLVKSVMVEGLLSIQAGDNPRVVEEKLKAFLAPDTRNTMGGSGAAEEEEE